MRYWVYIRICPYVYSLLRQNFFILMQFTASGQDEEKNIEKSLNNL